MKEQTKPIIATTLSGLLLKNEPWQKAHILWLETASKQLKDPSIMDWANKPNYFDCVDGIMARLYPKLDEKQRVLKAREIFFDSVVEYVKQNPKVRNERIIKYLTSLKEKYRLALITTNTSSALEKILGASKLVGFFDIKETSLPSEKDDKRAVFQRFISQYGKPLIYIGGSRKDSFDYCKENAIPSVFANLEGEEKIEGVEAIKNLEELKARIKKL
jgi:phosphoglycolate phosphatase-like HAD superfamily hydrolase